MPEETTKRKRSKEEPKKVDTKPVETKPKETKAVETKPETSPVDLLKAIDEKYNKSISKRIEDLSLKKKIENNAGTKSKTRIAGLRSLSPGWGQQFSK